MRLLPSILDWPDLRSRQGRLLTSGHRRAELDARRVFSGKPFACQDEWLVSLQHGVHDDDQLQIPACLDDSYTALPHKFHSLKLELAAKRPSLYLMSPIPWSRSYRRVHGTGSSPNWRAMPQVSLFVPKARRSSSTDPHRVYAP